jgi:hypothetical protein
LFVPALHHPLTARQVGFSHSFVCKGGIESVPGARTSCNSRPTHFLGIAQVHAARRNLSYVLCEAVAVEHPITMQFIIFPATLLLKVRIYENG